MSQFISGFCRITNDKVGLNDQLIYEGQEEALSDFLLEQSELGNNYPKIYKMDELSRFGVFASELILKDQNLTESYPPEEIAVVLSNYSSSLDTDRKYQKSTDQIPSPALFVYTLPNIVTGEICIRNGFKGENAFLIQKSFDAEFMVKYVDILLRTTPTKACLAGWVEVLGDNHDVFLYLVEEKKPEFSFNHSAQELLKYYNKY